LTARIARENPSAPKRIAPRPVDARGPQQQSAARMANQKRRRCPEDRVSDRWKQRESATSPARQRKSTDNLSNDRAGAGQKKHLHLRRGEPLPNPSVFPSWQIVEYQGS